MKSLDPKAIAFTDIDLEIICHESRELKRHFTALVLAHRNCEELNLEELFPAISRLLEVIKEMHIEQEKENGLDGVRESSDR